MPDSPFSPDVLAKSIHATLDEAFTAVPEDKHHVLLIDASRDAGVRALYAQRIGGGWNVALEGQWTGGGHVAGKVGVLKAW